MHFSSGVDTRCFERRNAEDLFSYLVLTMKIFLVSGVDISVA
jgi:hypothetical protein